MSNSHQGSQLPNAQIAQKQDYICKVRYQNDLPPPPCPPKLLKYTTFDPRNSLSDPALLTSMFRKENFKNLIPLDKELAMPFNLLEIPGLIESNDDQLMMAQKNQFQLHPEDELLLVDPQVYKSSKSQPVSFLRRTQYIAGRSASPAATSINSADLSRAESPQKATSSSLAARKRKTDDETNALAQVRAVEATFEKAAELEDADLSKVVHPTKKKLKAKKVWSFLPDVSIIDKNFISVKFNGSASVSRTAQHGLPESFKTSIFRPVNTERGEEWVSLFSTTSDRSKDLKKIIDDTSENVPVDESSLLDEPTEKFHFDHVRDYDMAFKRFDNEKEVALTFASNTAYFSPINGRIDLKRRRITPALEKIVKENTVDRLDVSVREPTTGEAIRRDNARSRFDPINYIEHEEDVDEDEDEAESAEAEGKAAREVSGDEKEEAEKNSTEAQDSDQENQSDD